MITSLYRLLEDKTPTRYKQLIPEKWRIWLGYQVKVARQRTAGSPGVQTCPPANVPGPPVGAAPAPVEFYHPLDVPTGETEASLRQYLAGFYVKGEGPSQERNDYLATAFKRFLYTLQIIPRRQGRLLEIGAAPYFTSLLLKKLTSYELTLTNYFGEGWGKKASQTLVGPDSNDIFFESDNVNVETERLPYEDASFDVVLFCEVLEHLTNDPCSALLEIKRVLKRGGSLILTTPNAARLESVDRLWAGKNIFDDYSAYGPYGRHNREYTFEEAKRLLEHAGFTVEEAFTSDVHAHVSSGHVSADALQTLLQVRPADLGQYSFVRAHNSHEARAKKPRWLYRSYPSTEIE